MIEFFFIFTKFKKKKRKKYYFDIINSYCKFFKLKQ